MLLSVSIDTISSQGNEANAEVDTSKVNVKVE
jgi:hypothetical protein